jgi:hypothetical protein
VILQVLADAWKIDDGIDADFLQLGGGADAGTHQDRRRVDGACRQHDFA